MSKSFDRLTLLNTFVRISEGGSISAAARILGISQPSASRQLVELESQLKTKLVNRNTHNLSLTDAGAELLLDARAMLEGWESIEEKHLNFEREVKGPIKVVAPVALGQKHLARIAAGFQLMHPNIKLSWQLEDGAIRFTEIGCDCWIKIGPVPDDTLIVKPVAKAVRRLVASPVLLKDKPRISVKNIGSLPIIALQPFEGGKVPLIKGGISRTVEFSPAMQTNNIFAAKEACIVGLGVSVMPTWFIDSELENGDLIDLLPDWQAPTLNISIAYLPNKFRPLRLTRFVDFLSSKIKGIPGIESL